MDVISLLSNCLCGQLMGCWNTASSSAGTQVVQNIVLKGD